MYSLLKESHRQDLITEKTFEPDDRDFANIRCPRCRWQPTASSTWYCSGIGTPEPSFEGCGTTWNTFVTRGRCPGCSHQWQWTVCHQCDGWSLHEDWYEERRRQ